MFVSVVTRLNGLYVLVETPQQNTDSGGEEEGGRDEVLTNSSLLVTKYTERFREMKCSRKVRDIIGTDGSMTM